MLPKNNLCEREFTWLLETMERRVETDDRCSSTLPGKQVSLACSWWFNLDMPLQCRQWYFKAISVYCLFHHHHHHLSLNREGRWGTTDNFAASFLHFSRFSTAPWDLAKARHVHSMLLSSNLFLCLPCLLPPFTVPCKMVLAPDLMNGRHEHTTAIRVSLRSSGGLRVDQLPAGSWHRLPRW